MPYDVSVIVRCRDKADTIRATLDSIRAQDRAAEIVVVDSGSVDATLDIVAEYTDRVIRIRPEEFTYGGTLNLGAEAAAAPIHVALSAHCTLPRTDWLSRVLAHYADPEVGGVQGGYLGPDWRVMDTVYRQSVEHLATTPAEWGFSNHAGSWRREAWETTRFRVDLPACEDKAWNWEVLEQGWKVVYDPALNVHSGHRRAQGMSANFKRSRNEGAALGALGVYEPPSHRDLARALWRHRSPYTDRPQFLHRWSPQRAVELVGHYRGIRDAVLDEQGRPIAGASGRHARPWPDLR